jgi:hypothetical protein
MCLFLPHVLYTVWCLSHITIIVKKIEKHNTQIGTIVKDHGFGAGLLARSWFESGRSCDCPTRSRFSMIFFGSRAYAELVPKFHTALHASHAAFPMVTLKISPCINVTLTFDFGLDQPVHRGYG